MGNAVFIQNPHSTYADEPGRLYHFPRRYLRAVEATVGDWAVFYESRAGSGRFGYVGVQRPRDVVPDPQRSDHFFALMQEDSLLNFDRVVPRADAAGLAYEASLRGVDGRPISGGVNVAAVRTHSEAKFAKIAAAGFAESPRHPDALPRQPDVGDGMAEPAGVFDGAPLAGFRPEMLASRLFRDRKFALQVKRAYGSRCAMSGLSLRNGGGRAEVEAAHIRPVAAKGPDIVQNGLALTGTLHWMFDRGLVGIADDHSILVSRNKVPSDVVDRLIRPDGRLMLPADPRSHPHPAYLRWHRENVYGTSAPL